MGLCRDFPSLCLLGSTRLTSPVFYLFCLGPVPLDTSLHSPRLPVLPSAEWGFPRHGCGKYHRGPRSWAHKSTAFCHGTVVMLAVSITQYFVQLSLPRSHGRPPSSCLGAPAAVDCYCLMGGFQS